MRIIAGTHRRRVILSPPEDATTRPYLDRVKEAVFNKLRAYEVLDENSSVLDVFSGTGTCGLEALSRGMKHCSFIERDPSPREYLERNIEIFGYEDQSVVLSADAMSGLWIPMLPVVPVGLIFLDPPFAMTSTQEDQNHFIGLIEQIRVMTEIHGMLVFRTPDEAHCPPLELDGWELEESKRYSASMIHYYWRKD